MALGWIEIEELTGVTKWTVRRWVKKYNFPLLRHPCGRPWISKEIYEEWLRIYNELRKGKIKKN